MPSENTFADDPLSLIGESSAAAFAVDRNDRLIYWNAGAEAILGWKAADVVGTFCFDALKGRDSFGNVYCSRDCPIMTGVAQGEIIHPYVMQVTKKNGLPENLLVRAVPLPGPGPRFTCLMHFIESGNGAEIDALIGRCRTLFHGDAPAPLPDPPQAISVSPLTQREREIVTLLSNGYLALNIAARLNLSHATVRNHIQNILRKLDVHSQVEAVSVAFRRGWL